MTGDPNELDGRQPSQIHQIVAARIGPLPPPSELAGYEEVLPGSADRILRMAEREQHIRENVVQAEIADASAARRQIMRGQWMGLGVAMMGIGAAILGASGSRVG